jgi:hypothetical protein
MARETRGAIACPKHRVDVHVYSDLLVLVPAEERERDYADLTTKI